MAHPQAVGAIPPRPGYIPPEGSSSVTDILERIEKHLAKLADRLAPEPILLPITFSAVPAGLAIGTVQLPSSGFNGILSCLSAGVVNVYFGSGATAVPDMQLTGGANPIYVPLPPQTERQIYIKVDDNSAVAATGILYLIQY